MAVTEQAHSPAEWIVQWTVFTFCEKKYIYIRKATLQCLLSLKCTTATTSFQQCHCSASLCTVFFFFPFLFTTENTARERTSRGTCFLIVWVLAQTGSHLLSISTVRDSHSDLQEHQSPRQCPPGPGVNHEIRAAFWEEMCGLRTWLHGSWYLMMFNVREAVAEMPISWPVSVRKWLQITLHLLLSLLFYRAVNISLQNESQTTNGAWGVSINHQLGIHLLPSEDCSTACALFLRSYLFPETAQIFSMLVFRSWASCGPWIPVTNEALLTNPVPQGMSVSSPRCGVYPLRLTCTQTTRQTLP